MTTHELLARFEVEYQIPRGLCAQRKREQLKELHRFAAQLNKPLEYLTQSDVLTYLGAELTRGLNPNTVRMRYMMLRSFVTWANAAGLIDDERARMIRLISAPRGSSPTSKPNPYTPTEVKRFRALLAEKYPPLPEYGRGSRLLTRYLQGKSDRLHGALWLHARRVQFEAQVALALELGLRSIEIVNLPVKAAHYENNEIVVQTAKQGPGEKVYRTVSWTPHAHACMQEWIDLRALLSPKHDSLWLTLDYHARGQEQLAPLTIERFHKALRVFGPGWRWHRFRHTAATEWLRAKMPLEKVRVLMGHARLDQTLEYAKILDSDISEAMEEAQDAFAKRMGLAA